MVRLEEEDCGVHNKLSILVVFAHTQTDVDNMKRKSTL